MDFLHVLRGISDMNSITLTDSIANLDSAQNYVYPLFRGYINVMTLYNGLLYNHLVIVRMDTENEKLEMLFNNPSEEENGTYSSFVSESINRFFSFLVR